MAPAPPGPTADPPIVAFDPNPDLAWLFVLPHPDDELAIAAWIRRRVRAVNRAMLCWVHDTPERREESEALARRLGLVGDQLVFLGLPDGGLPERLPELVDRLGVVVSDFGPDRVATAAFEQGHPDHDAVNFAVNQVWTGPTLEFPLYHSYATPWQTIGRFAEESGSERLDLDEEEQSLKVEWAKSFPSQNLWGALVWNEIRLVLTGRGGELRRWERLRVQRHLDFETPNLPPRLAERVRRTRSWRRWSEAVARWRDRP
ncbi:MAG: PIG-L family deacetylase [Fimbriimonadaceae bacterium]